MEAAAVRVCRRPALQRTQHQQQQQQQQQARGLLHIRGACWSSWQGELGWLACVSGWPPPIMYVYIVLALLRSHHCAGTSSLGLTIH